MIEEYLVNFGTLGLWCAYLVIKEKTFHKKMERVLEQNNQALTLIERKL